MADMWTVKETKPVLIVYVRCRQARPPFTHPTRKTTTKLSVSFKTITHSSMPRVLPRPIVLSQYCPQCALPFCVNGSWRMRAIYSENQHKENVAIACILICRGCDLSPSIADDYYICKSHREYRQDSLSLEELVLHYVHCDTSIEFLVQIYYTMLFNYKLLIIIDINYIHL